MDNKNSFLFGQALMDTEKARQMYYDNLNAAFNNNSNAQLHVGVSFRLGIGVERDETKFIQYMTLSSNNHNKKACYYLGEYYLNETNLIVSALYFLELSSQLKYSPADIILGKHYRETGDYKKEAVHFIKAFQAGAYTSKNHMVQFNMQPNC